MKSPEPIKLSTTKLMLIDQSLAHLTETINRIENKMDNNFYDVNLKLKEFDKKIDIKFEKHDKELDTFNARLWSNFYWLLGAMFSLSCAGAAILAKGFGWFDVN